MKEVALPANNMRLYTSVKRSLRIASCRSELYHPNDSYQGAKQTLGNDFSELPD